MPKPQSQQNQPQPNDENFALRTCAVEVESVERAEGDGSDDVVRASFSAETPVLEYGKLNGTYQELYRILDHSPSSVDLSRVKDGMCIEDNHWGDQIGLADVALEGKALRGTIRFGASDRAKVIETDAKAKIRRNLSIYAHVDPNSYKIEGAKDGIPVVRVMAWTPLTAAFVNMQADPAVGVGRELSQTEPETPAELKTDETPNETTQRSVNIMPEAPEPKVLSNEDIVRMYTLARHQKVEPGEVEEAIRSGKTYAEFSDWVLAREVPEPPENPIVREAKPEVGMTPKEVQKWSLIRAINSVVDNKPSFEREVSDEVARMVGAPAQGIYMPCEVAQRDLTTGGSGGNLVATDLLSGSFIERLRSAMVLDELGVRMMGGLQGDISIPKQTGNATGYWVAEGVSATESNQTLAQVTGRPHTCGALTDISRRMRLQSSIDAEAFVMQDLAEVLGRTIQTAVFAGSGTAGQPKGLSNADDLNAGTITTAGSATWANILTFVGLIMADNISPENAKWCMRPLVWSNLAGLPKVSAEATFILNTEAKNMAGFGYSVTTGVPAKSMFFGVWSNLILAMWGALDLAIDTATGSASGTTRVVGLQDTDVLVRHGQAFSYNAAVIA